MLVSICIAELWKRVISLQCGLMINQSTTSFASMCWSMLLTREQPSGRYIVYWQKAQPRFSKCPSTGMPTGQSSMLDRIPVTSVTYGNTDLTSEIGLVISALMHEQFPFL